MSLQKNFSRADRFCPPLLNCTYFDERAHINLKMKTSSRMLKSNHPLIFASKNTDEKIDHFSKFLSFLGSEKILTVNFQIKLQKNFSRADRFCPTRRNCLHFDERVDTNLKVKASSRMLKSNHPLLFASKNTNEKIDHLSKVLSFWAL